MLSNQEKQATLDSLLHIATETPSREFCNDTEDFEFFVDKMLPNYRLLSYCGQTIGSCWMLLFC